jgi:hypothetical protein
MEKKFTNNFVEQLDERKCSECYKWARPKNNPTEKMLTLWKILFTPHNYVFYFFLTNNYEFYLLTPKSVFMWSEDFRVRRNNIWPSCMRIENITPNAKSKP